MYLHVQSSDVIKIIQQFLKEQNLMKTFQCLQDESGVDFNAINDDKKLDDDILNGKWYSVLESLKTVNLPQSKLMDLYEQILIELAEIGDIETSIAILKSSSTIDFLKKQYTARIQQLHRALTRYPFETTEYYATPKERLERRKIISEAILDEVYTVQSSRLLTLINQSLKWQQSLGMLPKGSKQDLVKGCAVRERSQKEKLISRLDCVAKFGENGETFAECVEFSPDGQLLVTGTVDGFVEVWDYETAKIRKDLKYQAEDEFMVHEAAVMCLCFSKDSERVAIGTKDGHIKIFRLLDGECVEFFKDVHGGSVTSLQFSPDGSQILSAALDFTAKIHGVRSKSTLITFTGHKSFVNKAIFLPNSLNVMTASSDGTIKIWDFKDGACLKTIVPNTDRDSDKSIATILQCPYKPELMFVAFKANFINLIKMDGAVLKTFVVAPQAKVDVSFVSMAVSAKGKYLYASDMNQIIYCFSVETGKLLNAAKGHEKDVLAMAHHPHLNVLSTVSTDGSMRIWCPKK